MTDPTLSRVSTLVAEICAVPASSVRADAKLRSYGLDSVRVFELVILVEDAFGLRFRPDAFDELKGATVADLAAYVDRLRSSP